MTDLGRLRAVAMTVAAEAAGLVAATRESAVIDVRTKSTETDVVTAGDRAAERLIRERLGDLRPGEPVFGEEEGGALAVREADGVGWVVDPIDGTVNYLYGLPWYAVSVAATYAGATVAAAVVEPVSGRVWSAARGRGATLGERPLRVSAVRRLDLALIGTGYAYSPALRSWQAGLGAELAVRARDVRRGGSAVLDLCSVAAGWLDGYVEHALSPWDWAGASLIAAEAGAVVRLPRADGTDPDGLGADATMAVAPGVADQLAAVVREVAATR
ncbi:MAG TPA: inositol monophosphatase family protein [Pseudonocardiaceae bacterium]